MACVIHVEAQSLVVKSFKQTTSSLPERDLVYDNNEEVCAVIRIKTPQISGIFFKGNIMGVPKYKDGIYTLYITHAKRLSYLHEDYLPGTIEFSDWDITAISGNEYVMELAVNEDKIIFDGRIPSATLSVTSDVEGAQVFIDDVLIGNTPIEKQFDWFGPYKVTVQKEGYKKIIKNVELIENKSTKVNAILNDK